MSAEELLENDQLVDLAEEESLDVYSNKIAHLDSKVLYQLSIVLQRHLEVYERRHTVAGAAVAERKEELHDLDHQPMENQEATTELREAYNSSVQLLSGQLEETDKVLQLLEEKSAMCTEKIQQVYLIPNGTSHASFGGEAGQENNDNYYESIEPYAGAMDPQAAKNSILEEIKNRVPEVPAYDDPPSETAPVPPTRYYSKAPDSDIKPIRPAEANEYETIDENVTDSMHRQLDLSTVYTDRYFTEVRNTFYRDESDQKVVVDPASERAHDTERTFSVILSHKEETVQSEFDITFKRTHATVAVQGSERRYASIDVKNAPIVPGTSSALFYAAPPVSTTDESYTHQAWDPDTLVEDYANGLSTELVDQAVVDAARFADDPWSVVPVPENIYDLIYLKDQSYPYEELVYQTDLNDSQQHYAPAPVLPAEREQWIYDDEQPSISPIELDYLDQTTPYILEEPLYDEVPFENNEEVPEEVDDNMLNLPTVRLPVDAAVQAVDFSEEEQSSREWDPRPLVDYLYRVDYTPRQEQKTSRLLNAEGPLLHLPLNDELDYVVQFEKHYFRTDHGQLLWYKNNPDENPIGSMSLGGAAVELVLDEGIIRVLNRTTRKTLILKCEESLCEPWRNAILSHASLVVEPKYVQPLASAATSPDNALIIELGTCSVRAGFATTEPSLPQTFFPAVAAVLPSGQVIVGRDAFAPGVRQEAQIVWPGYVKNSEHSVRVDLMAHIFAKVFDDLQVNAQNHKIILSVSQRIAPRFVGDLLRLLLVHFQCQAVAVLKQSVLVLYSYDSSTGVVVDIGEHFNIVPVVDGYVLEGGIMSLAKGAQNLQEALRPRLHHSNPEAPDLRSPVERLILRYITEQTAYVAVPNIETELDQYQDAPNEVDTVVSLDDFEPTADMKSKYRVDHSRFSACEGFFNPKTWFEDTKGLDKLVHSAIQASPVDNRRTLYRNIYLCGGSSLITKLAERLELELAKLVPPSVQIQVHISPWRYHAAFIGAQIVSASPQLKQLFLKADQIDAFVQTLYTSAL